MRRHPTGDCIMRVSLFCLVLFPLAALGAEKPIEVMTLDRKEPIAYEKDIEPIFKNKCTVCHSGNQCKGKFDAASYVSVMKGSGKGPVIVPGKSAESALVRSAGKTGKPFMPPKDEEPLTPQELALIKLWIDQGAKPPSGMGERPKIALYAPPANIVPVRAIAIGSGKTTAPPGRAN